MTPTFNIRYAHEPERFRAGSGACRSLNGLFAEGVPEGLKAPLGKMARVPEPPPDLSEKPKVRDIVAPPKPIAKAELKSIKAKAQRVVVKQDKQTREEWLEKKRIRSRENYTPKGKVFYTQIPRELCAHEQGERKDGISPSGSQKWVCRTCGRRRTAEPNKGAHVKLGLDCPHSRVIKVGFQGGQQRYRCRDCKQTRVGDTPVSAQHQDRAA